MIKYVLMLVAISLALVNNSYAEYYKYVDENGNVVFTDNMGNIPKNQISTVKTIKEQQDAPQTANKVDLSNKHKSVVTDRPHSLYDPKKDDSVLKSCASESKERAAQAIKTTWSSMTQAMGSDNLNQALSFISVPAIDEMKRKMADMSREQRRQIVSNYKSIQIESLHLDYGVAECGIIREEKGGELYSYPARFVRDTDCAWRLRGM